MSSVAEASRAQAGERAKTPPRPAVIELPKNVASTSAKVGILARSRIEAKRSLENSARKDDRARMSARTRKELWSQDARDQVIDWLGSKTARRALPQDQIYYIRLARHDRRAPFRKSRASSQLRDWFLKRKLRLRQRLNVEIAYRFRTPDGKIAVRILQKKFRVSDPANAKAEALRARAKAAEIRSKQGDPVRAKTRPPVEVRKYLDALDPVLGAFV